LDNAGAAENALEVPVPSNRTFNYNSGISFIKSSYRQTLVSKLRGNDERAPFEVELSSTSSHNMISGGSGPHINYNN